MELQNLNQDFTKAKLDIADNVLRILGLVDNISDLRKAFAVDEKALSEKYGENASIDIATGEVKQVVKEEAEPVK